MMGYEMVQEGYKKILKGIQEFNRIKEGAMGSEGYDGVSESFIGNERSSVRNIQSSLSLY